MNIHIANSIVIADKTYTKNSLIALADEAKNPFNQALILLGKYKNIVTIHDYHEAGKKWISEALLLRWEGDIDTIHFLKKMGHSVDTTLKQYRTNLGLLQQSKQQNQLSVTPKVTTQKKQDVVVKLGVWLLDVTHSRLRKNDKSCHIPFLEAQLLKVLMEAGSKCVSDKELADIIKKQINHSAKTDTLMRVQSTITLIRSRIRRGLKEIDCPIVRESGIGYRFRP